MPKLLRLIHTEVGCWDPERKREYRVKTLNEWKGYVETYKKLPDVCDGCYTVNIYTARGETNIDRFSKMLYETFEQAEENIKYDRLSLRVKGEESKESWISELQEKMAKYDVDGRVEWRIGCKDLEKMFPKLFKGAKTISDGWQLEMDL